MRYKRGDKVLCIGMCKHYSNKLTIGRVYTVAEYTNSNPIWIRVFENKRVNDYCIDYFLHLGSLKNPDSPILKLITLTGRK